MLEYFKNQLDESTLWTSEMVEESINKRLVEGNITEDQVDSERERLSKYVGHKLVFFLVRDANIVKVLKALDCEIESLSNEYEFICQGVSFPEFKKKV